MPQGDKSSYTDKQKRKAAHIEEGYQEGAWALPGEKLLLRRRILISRRNKSLSSPLVLTAKEG